MAKRKTVLGFIVLVGVIVIMIVGVWNYRYPYVPDYQDRQLDILVQRVRWSKEESRRQALINRIRKEAGLPASSAGQ